MTPEQEVIVRRLCRYAMTPEGRMDRTFTALAMLHAPWICSTDTAFNAEIDAISKNEREQIDLDELDRRLDKL